MSMPKIVNEVALLPFAVLLYYQYVDIDDPAKICSWQHQVCEENALNGRIRVSKEGINGTLSGTGSSIALYIEDFFRFPALSPHTIDWKISGPVNNMALEQQHFKELSITISKEVVSLDLTEKEKQVLIAVGPGAHLTPQQFHAELENMVSFSEASNDVSESGTDNEKGTIACPSEIILLDVRNSYESAIGRFVAPSGTGGLISVIDPQTRQFSEFKNFVANNKELLSSKRVLMYCTGGVRCERASALLRLNGINNIGQLSGGIHAYQEAFPHGGFFKGKNFVYDPRIAIPYKFSDETIGQCCLCSDYYDDYSPRIRCKRCRVLQLVCDNCRVSDQFQQSSLCCTYCSAQTENKN